MIQGIVEHFPDLHLYIFSSYQIARYLREKRMMNFQRRLGFMTESETSSYTLAIYLCPFTRFVILMFLKSAETRN